MVYVPFVYMNQKQYVIYSGNVTKYNFFLHNLRDYIYRETNKILILTKSQHYLDSNSKTMCEKNVILLNARFFHI